MCVCVCAVYVDDHMHRSGPFIGSPRTPMQASLTSREAKGNVGALIIRIGFRGIYCTIVMKRSPQKIHVRANPCRR